MDSKRNKEKLAENVLHHQVTVIEDDVKGKMVEVVVEDEDRTRKKNNVESIFQNSMILPIDNRFT